MSSSSSSSSSSSGNTKLVVEQNMLAAYEDLLQNLAEADRRFLAVADSVHQLQKEGERARDTLSQCSSSSGVLLAKVDGLVAELAEIQQREQRISTFIRSFQISDQDGLILRKGDVSHDFLDALAKLQQIHDSCKKFTSSPSSSVETASPEQQQAAVEVMESTFLLHMSSLEKVSNYIASVAPEICGGDISALDHSVLFVEAVRSLQSNPGLWAKAVHEIARVRRSAILRRLATQSAQIIREANARHQQDQKRKQQQQQQQNETTSSSSSNTSSSSLNNNNIPLRILGDLCAWLDECSVDERESASAFFAPSSSASSTSANGNNNTKGTPTTPNGDYSSTSTSSSSLSVVSAHFTLQDYLDSVFDAAARQLKTRAVELIQELADSVWPRKSGSIMLAVAAYSSATSLSSSSSGGGVGVGVDSSSSSSASNLDPSGRASEVLSLLEDGGRVQNLIALFKSESLLGFYGERVSEVFGKSSAVVSSLSDAKLESMRYFFELLQGVSAALRLACDTALHQVELVSSSSSSSSSGISKTGNNNTNTGLFGSSTVPRSDAEDDDAYDHHHHHHELATHPSISAASGILRSLLQVIDQSTIPQAQRGVESAPLLTALLDPIYSSLEKAHAAIAKKIEAESSSSSAAATMHTTSSNSSTSSSLPLSASTLLAVSVYSINTLCVALSSILPFEFAAQKQNQLTAMLEDAISRYIKSAIVKTQERLELDVAYRLVSQKPRPSKESASLAMKVFFAGIFSGEGVCPLPVPFLEEIQPIRVRERCRREVVDAVCQVYDEICEIVASDIEPDAVGRKMILHHTPEQLRLLLE